MKLRPERLIYLYSVAKAMEKVAETDANLFIVDATEVSLSTLLQNLSNKSKFDLLARLLFYRLDFE